MFLIDISLFLVSFFFLLFFQLFIIIIYLEGGIYRILLGFWKVLNPFLTYWSWEKCFKPLIRTHWGAFMCEHMKRKSVFAQRFHYQGQLSCPLLRFRWSDYDVIITWYHQKLVEEMHTFHLDPTLHNLKVCSSIFICLMMLTWSAKTIETEMSRWQTMCHSPSLH